MCVSRKLNFKWSIGVHICLAARSASTAQILCDQNAYKTCIASVRLFDNIAISSCSNVMGWCPWNECWLLFPLHLSIRKSLSMTFASTMITATTVITTFRGRFSMAIRHDVENASQPWMPKSFILKLCVWNRVISALRLPCYSLQECCISKNGGSHRTYKAMYLTLCPLYMELVVMNQCVHTKLWWRGINTRHGFTLLPAWTCLRCDAARYFFIVIRNISYSAFSERI